MVEPLSMPEDSEAEPSPPLVMDTQQKWELNFVVLSHSSFGVAVIVAPY